MTAAVKENGHEIQHTESNGSLKESESRSQFASILLTIPVVADSFNCAKNTKYGYMAVTATGAALNTVSKITGPLQPQINQVDKFAANTVKVFGDRVPAIKTPTNDIIEKVKTPIGIVNDEFEQRVAAPAKKIHAHVHAQIHAQIHPLAKNIDRSIQPVVDRYAFFVESYLPQGDESGEEGDEASEFQQTQRALKTTAKAQRRLSQHLKSRFTSTQNYTQEQIRQLHEQSALLRNVTEALNEINLKLITLKDSVQSPDLAVSIHARLQGLVSTILGELDKEKDLPKAVKERIIELSQNLVSTTDSIASYVRANAGHFPEHIKQNLAPLISFFSDRYTELIEEINRNDTTALEKARHIAQVTGEHVLPILEQSLAQVQRSFHFYGSTSTNNVNESMRSTAGVVDVSS